MLLKRGLYIRCSLNLDSQKCIADSVLKRVELIDNVLFHICLFVVEQWQFTCIHSDVETLLCPRIRGDRPHENFLFLFQWCIVMPDLAALS